MNALVLMSRIEKQHPAILAVLSASAVIFVFALVAISSQSLWIDEFGTWKLTIADTWGEWLHQMQILENSDAQIPLYNLYMRLWVEFFPASEISLRMANLPWLWLALFVLWRTPMSQEFRRLPMLMTVIVASHCMVWYYVNEARSYSMLLAGVLIAGSGLLAKLDKATPGMSEGRGNVELITGCALMAATSVLGLIWTVSFVAPALWLSFRAYGWRLGFGRKEGWWLLGCLVFLAPFLYQYFDAYVRGVSSTVLHEHKIQNFIFGFYEISGLSGLGPGREDIRSVGASAIKAYALPTVLGGVLVVGVFARGLGDLFRQHGRDALILLLFALLPVCILYYFGAVKHWRVLGRHMLPLIFFFALVLSTALHQLLKSNARRRFGVVALALLLLVFLVSSLQIALSTRHGREDYRRAVEVARKSVDEGRTVWWVASDTGLEYYRLKSAPVEACGTLKSGDVVFLSNADPNVLALCPTPGVVLLSRRDTFDRTGAVSNLLSKQHYVLENKWIGFEVWVKR